MLFVFESIRLLIYLDDELHTQSPGKFSFNYVNLEIVLLGKLCTQKTKPQMGKCLDIDHKYILIIFRLYTDYNHAVIVSF